MSFFTARDGARLAYGELGEGRPPILLHGAVGGGALWLHRGQAKAFAEAGYGVILPDFHGQGLSDEPGGHGRAASTPGFVAAMLGFLTAA